MANKTITQLDTAQTLDWNMVIPVELNGNTYKASLGQIKSYCEPSGTINITSNGTYNVAGYGTASVLVEPTIESLSIIPSTSSQTITAPSGTDGYSPISVAAVTSSIDANITAENIRDGVNILGVTGNYTGTTPTKKYNLLDRVTDDSNNEIGTVSGFFTDANGDRYAVVCLDAQYRLASGNCCNDTLSQITNLPIYDSTTWGPWEAKETATFNTQTILDYCTANNFTSTACTHCRTLSFIIDGISYAGQLPNMIELNDILRNHTQLNTKDTTASSYTSVNFASSKNAWSSTQFSNTSGWVSTSIGSVDTTTKTTNYVVVPVLEIPL